MIFSSYYRSNIEKSSRDHLTWHAIPLWEQMVKSPSKWCRVSNQNSHLDPTYRQHPSCSEHGYALAQPKSHRQQTKLHPAWNNTRETARCCSIKAKLWLNICNREQLRDCWMLTPSFASYCCSTQLIRIICSQLSNMRFGDFFSFRVKV